MNPALTVIADAIFQLVIPTEKWETLTDAEKDKFVENAIEFDFSKISSAVNVASANSKQVKCFVRFEIA